MIKRDSSCGSARYEHLPAWFEEKQQKKTTTKGGLGSTSCNNKSGENVRKKFNRTLLQGGPESNTSNLQSNSSRKRWSPRRQQSVVCGAGAGAISLSCSLFSFPSHNHTSVISKRGALFLYGWPMALPQIDNLDLLHSAACTSKQDQTRYV